MVASSESFTTVRTLGGLLPVELLERVRAGDRDIEGLTAADYHLLPGEPLREAVSRSWNRLLGAWQAFRAAAAALPDAEPGTSLTRERWLLVLFAELGYGRLQTSRAVELDGRTYPVSHAWGHTPIHLVSFRLDLDRRAPGAAGAARAAPHSLVQELLNRADDRLWGLVSNGLVLRLLRDNAALTRQAFVEFDLQAMMMARSTPTSCCCGSPATSPAWRASGPRAAGWNAGCSWRTARAPAPATGCATASSGP